ncbi:MAG TPA: hypothetical protein VF723_03300 [Pyrinomonadaceae bacterium]
MMNSPASATAASGLFAETIDVPGTELKLKVVSDSVVSRNYAEAVVRASRIEDVVCIELKDQASIERVFGFVRDANEARAKDPDLVRPTIVVFGSASELPEEMLEQVEHRVVPEGAVLYEYEDESLAKALDAFAQEVAEVYIPFELKSEETQSSLGVESREPDDLDSGRRYDDAATDYNSTTVHEAVSAVANTSGS